MGTPCCYREKKKSPMGPQQKSPAEQGSGLLQGRELKRVRIPHRFLKFGTPIFSCKNGGLWTGIGIPFLGFLRWLFLLLKKETVLKDGEFLLIPVYPTN